jgi:formylglycine-generating enzyme required for sulfatase activity
VFLPSENEWYKAAYYNSATSSYYQYPTSSNTAPTASGPTATPNSANFSNAVGHLTDVGAYTGTTSPYGAFDMGGNVNQWTDTVVPQGPGYLPSSVFFGGGFGDPIVRLLSTFIDYSNPTGENTVYGFRVASIAVVPEPSSVVLATFGFIGLTAWRCRRRERWAR